LNPQFLFALNADIPCCQPLIGMDLQTVIGMIPNLFNFIALAALLTWLLYKPVKKILQARADRVEGDMSEAALSKATAAELKTHYEQKVRDIEVERAAILEEARKLANENRERIVSDAKAEAHDVKERANRDIATEREQIKGAVHQAIIDISTDMAAKLIAATVDKTTHDKLFSEAMTELEATTAFRTDSVTA